MTNIPEIQNKRIMVVEDELLIGLDISEALFAAGANTFGPVTNFADAKKVAELHSIDAAVLDFNIAGTEVTPLAQYLSERGIPFIVLTADPGRAENAGLGALAEIHRKPVSGKKILDQLTELLT